MSPDFFLPGKGIVPLSIDFALNPLSSLPYKHSIFQFKPTNEVAVIPNRRSSHIEGNQNEPTQAHEKETDTHTLGNAQ